MDPLVFAAFSDNAARLEKYARNALLRHLDALPEIGQKALLSRLPAAARETASYKLLGHRAADAVRKGMVEGAGHGPSHVWAVTRNAQELLGTRAAGHALPAASAVTSPQVYRRSVLGSLLHDIGRPAEGQAMHQLQEQLGAKAGKAVVEATPALHHSELSGRFVDHWLREGTNPALAKNVGGLAHGQLEGVVRAHDTDIHKMMPWTERLLHQDPAAATTYLADKMEGLGQRGINRTIETGRHFREDPSATLAAMQRNVPKYTRAIDTYSPNDIARKTLAQRLAEYKQGMGAYAAQNGLVAPAVAPAAPLAMAKSASSVSSKMLDASETAAKYLTRRASPLKWRAQKALGHAALGALPGAAAGAIYDEHKADKDGEHHRLRRIGGGALAGGLSAAAIGQVALPSLAKDKAKVREGFKKARSAIRSGGFGSDNYFSRVEEHELVGDRLREFRKNKYRSNVDATFDAIRTTKNHHRMQAWLDKKLKTAGEYPPDYFEVRQAVLDKLAWSWEGFKEGVRDEGIPLGGAVIGAGLGSIYNKGLTGAALGYAAGGGASILRSKLLGEEISPEQKVLALSALGYGAGGLLHAGLAKSRPHGVFGEVEKGLPWKTNLVRGITEEGLPAIGAVLGTGTAMATTKRHPTATIQQPEIPTP